MALKWSLALAVVAGLATTLAAAVASSVWVDRDPGGWAILAIITAATLATTFFPISFGRGETVITLESVPLVLGAVYLAPSDAVLVAVVLLLWAMRNLPGEIGWRETAAVLRFEVPRAAIAMASACGLARLLDAGSDNTHLLLALPVAVAWELVSDLLFFANLDHSEPGAARQVLPGAYVPAMTSMLFPAIALIAMEDYLHEPTTFALVLGVLLVVMYLGLWVANSQQLEKRRGEHMRDTFGRYLPEALVGAQYEAMQEVHLGGEQREVTVLFCDIRGFTSWSENREAEEIITQLNDLLSELSAAVMQHEGTLDKYTGDGLMAFWGAPLAVEDHAARACEAALEMLQRLDTVNEQRAADGQEPFAIGVGVHSGTAVVGNIGHEQRLDYTAIGDTVNLSARLEAATKDIGSVLLVSRETIDRLPDELRQRAMRIGDIRVKGRRQPVEAWALQPLRPQFEEIGDLFAA